MDLMSELEIKLRCLEAAAKIHEGQARADDSENVSTAKSMNKAKALFLLSAAFAGLSVWASFHDFVWTWDSFVPLLSAFAVGFLAGSWCAFADAGRHRNRSTAKSEEASKS